jgi:hypothetical protein
MPQYTDQLDELAERVLGDDFHKDTKSSSELNKILDPLRNLFIEGDIVDIVCTSYIGEFIGFNTKQGGLYPGWRYPLLVKIISSTNKRFDRCVGSVFEYTTEFIYHKEILTKGLDDYCNGSIDEQLQEDGRYIRCLEYWKRFDNKD